jgi:hypothetical protein
LRDAVDRVTKLFRDSVFVDRRVDPDLRVTLQLEATSIDDVLRAMAEAESLGMSRLGALRYLGPRHAAQQLRTVAMMRSDDVARLPYADRSQLERKQGLHWPRLSEPRMVVNSVAEQRGWRIFGGERIPHDLWSAAELPALNAAEQLTMLLVGFDLTFNLHTRERALEIVPLGKVAVRREYRVPSQISDPTYLLQQELPSAVARLDGRSLMVEARIEDHERLAELMSGRSVPRRAPRPSRQTERVYTLRVEEQPIGAVLRQLAERLQWTMEIDESSIRAAGLSLETRVSFQVEDSSEEELLNAALRPAGLNYQRENNRLRIVPGAGRP